MNQRTLELALQAGLKKDHASDREYTGEFDWREFSQLMVQECQTVVKWAISVDATIDRVPGLIKEHFGVDQ